MASDMQLVSSLYQETEVLMSLESILPLDPANSEAFAEHMLGMLNSAALSLIDV